MNMYIMVNDVNFFINKIEKNQNQIFFMACNYVLVCHEKYAIYDSMILGKKRTENFIG